MHAEILTIGSELTSGITVNTNAAYLARELNALGIDCHRQTSVGDNPTDLLLALTEAIQRSRLVVTTGGLGPTFDDMTMQAVSQALGQPLRYFPSAALSIRRFYQKRHRTLRKEALRQAYLPQKGQALPNPIGTAPGLWFSSNGSLLIALPGVPSEMRAIFEASVLPRLKRLNRLQAIQTRILRSAGLVELEIESILKKIPLARSLDVGLYPNSRLVDIRLTAKAESKKKAQALVKSLESKLRKKLGRHIYGTDNQNLEQVIGSLLLQKNRTIALAESCTGGLVSNRLTDIPGSSRYFKGAIIAYDDSIKRKSLGVSRSLLLRKGAVSAETACAMAEGVKYSLKTDIGLSLTGIAGPSGGSAKKPVGLVYFGLADEKKTRSLKQRFTGSRQTIKMQAAQTALDWLRRELLA